jgi:hypothetical protein
MILKDEILKNKNKKALIEMKSKKKKEALFK